MKKTLLTAGIAIFSLAGSYSFTEESKKIEITTLESEIDRTQEQKKALLEMYNELTEEQQIALKEEFDAQMEEFNKKIQNLSHEGQE